MQLVHEVQKFMSNMGEPEQFQGRIIFMSMFNDIIWGHKDNETECIANSTLVSLFAKKISSRTLVIPRTWVRDKVPVFGATSPFSRGVLKSKGGGKLSIHFCADGHTIETVFRTIISVNQLSIYGEVSDLCGEYSSCRTRTGRLVVAEQSDPLFASADLLIMTLHKKIFCRSTRNEWKGFHHQIN